MRRLVVLLALLLPATPAAAAPTPDRTAVLSAGSLSYAWDGQQATAAAPQQSVRGFDPNLCTKEPDYYCDVTHVKLEAAPDTTAELQFDIFDFSFALADFDLSIFHSDEAGTPGEFIANGGNLSAAGLEETVIVPEAAPGHYLVTVSYYFSPNASYKGTIAAKGITPPPPAPAAQPAPPAGRPAPGAAKAPPKMRVRSITRRGRDIMVRFTRAPRRGGPITLRDRRGRVVARGRLAAGSRLAKLFARRVLPAGRYRLRVGEAVASVRIR